MEYIRNSNRFLYFFTRIQNARDKIQSQHTHTCNLILLPHSVLSKPRCAPCYNYSLESRGFLPVSFRDTKWALSMSQMLINTINENIRTADWYFLLNKEMWRFYFIRKPTEGLVHHVDWVKIIVFFIVELISRPQPWNSLYVCLFVFFRTDKQV